MKEEKTLDTVGMLIEHVWEDPNLKQEKKIIKVVGVGGGGCNAVSNMYAEGMDGVTFAVCDTNKDSLNTSPVPYKLLLGKSGLGAGSKPEQGRKEAELTLEEIKNLFGDDTKMAFITAGMGSGTGTGAAPLVASVSRSLGILTIGIVTLPFYFEKRRKIYQALIGLEEMRKNVDALLIINNQQICNIYSNAKISVAEAFAKADFVLCDAARSISELITITGKIDVDFRDVEATMRNGGGAIMAMGRASGEHRIEQAFENALNSPLLYGSDISKAKRILFNIYSSKENPLFVNELEEVDAFMDSLNPNIEVIWGTANDDTLGDDVKVTILATGFENRLWNEEAMEEQDLTDEEYLDELILKLYGVRKRKYKAIPTENDESQPTLTVQVGQEQITMNVETKHEQASAEQPMSVVPEGNGAVSTEPEEADAAEPKTADAATEDDDAVNAKVADDTTSDDGDPTIVGSTCDDDQVPSSKSFLKAMRERFNQIVHVIIEDSKEN